MFCKLTVNFCIDILAVFLTLMQQIDTSFLFLSTARCTYLTLKEVELMMVETCYGQKFERPLNDDFIESFNHRKLSLMYIGYVVNFSLALFT